MGSIVLSTFKKTITDFPTLNHQLLKEVLTELNSLYSARKRTEAKVEFTKIRNQVLLNHGPLDLFEFQAYKQAIGKYYALRKAEKKLDHHEVGTVLEAGTHEVLIVVTPEVNILFSAGKLHGKLDFNQVIVAERFATFGSDLRVSAKEFHTAKVKALAIMNSHRGF